MGEPIRFADFQCNSLVLPTQNRITSKVEKTRGAILVRAVLLLEAFTAVTNQIVLKIM